MASVQFKNISKVYPDGTRAVDRVSLDIRDGELLVLVGPSGCGKSTLIRMLAGLETVTDGELVIGDRPVTHLRPQQRNTAMVFQNYALYPHMTVRQNLVFPLKMQKLEKQTIDQKISKTSRLLELEALLDRRPKQLSGGQRQRVAMGRALVREPAVFLMDEPLSNLDAKLRMQIRGDIATLQQSLGTTTLYVTHDQVEAMTLGHRICVVRDGAVQQLGTPTEIYEKPANLFVGTFFGSPGMNVVPVNVTRDGAVYTIAIGAQQIPVTATPLDPFEPDPRQTYFLGFRPEMLRPVSDDAGERGITPPVRNVELLGHEQILYAEITSLPEKSVRLLDQLEALGVRPGVVAARISAGSGGVSKEKATFVFNAGHIHLFDTEKEWKRTATLALE